MHINYQCLHCSSNIKWKYFNVRVQELESLTVKQFHCELGLKKLNLIHWAFLNGSVTEGELLSKAVFSPFIVIKKIKIGNLFHTCKFSSLYLRL